MTNGAGDDGISDSDLQSPTSCVDKFKTPLLANKNLLRREPCLICSSLEYPSPEDFPTFPGSCFPKSVTVNEHMWSIFVLGTLLDFPTEKCKNLFEVGFEKHPAEWFGICVACSKQVIEGFYIHLELIKLKKLMMKVKEEVMGKLSLNLKLEDEFLESRGIKAEQIQAKGDVRQVIRDYFRGKRDFPGAGANSGQNDNAKETNEVGVNQCRCKDQEVEVEDNQHQQQEVEMRLNQGMEQDMKVSTSQLEDVEETNSQANNDQIEVQDKIVCLPSDCIITEVDMNEILQEDMIRIKNEPIYADEFKNEYSSQWDLAELPDTLLIDEITETEDVLMDSDSEDWDDDEEEEEEEFIEADLNVVQQEIHVTPAPRTKPMQAVLNTRNFASPNSVPNVDVNSHKYKNRRAAKLCRLNQKIKYETNLLLADKIQKNNEKLNKEKKELWEEIIYMRNVLKCQLEAKKTKLKSNSTKVQNQSNFTPREYNSNSNISIIAIKTEVDLD